VAILLELSPREMAYLARVLVGECAYCAKDPDLGGLHGRLLLFLRAVCEGRPLVVVDAGRRLLIGAIARMQAEHRRAPEARSILARLTPSTTVWVTS
jgi:hypothetical protein